MPAGVPLSTLLSHMLVAFTIELDNEFEHRLAQAGGGARVASLVMWSNFMRFVGEGVTVGDLPTVSGLPKARMLSTLGGMERWRYVFVGPETTDRPPAEKRDGWGSARGLRKDWVVRPTPAGRSAREIWQPLFDDIEKRWEERFGADAKDELTSSLEAIVARLDVELPEYLPIVGSANGMATGISPRGKSAAASRLQLSALLSQALLAYAIDFEGESELSLPLSANFVRVLDERGVPVRELPLVAGVSKEATSMALKCLARAGHVVVEGASASTSLSRLTAKGREAQERAPRLHAEVEVRWETRFGPAEVRRLRASLLYILDQRDGLSRGLEPYQDGWRASKPYLELTSAVIADPRLALPHYPMVLHRGGWPDGS
jgi:hypothetical protein